MNKYRKILILSFLLLGLSSILGEELPRLRSKPRKKCINIVNEVRSSCLKKWTVLIYMAADNDLSPYSLWDLYEMETKIKGEINSGASTEILDVLVELDTLGDSGSRRIHVKQGNEIYDETLTVQDFEKLDERSIRSSTVDWFSEKEMDKLSVSERLLRFLEWGQEKYPSENYMVVLWGHGEGYLGKTFVNNMKNDLAITPTKNKNKSRYFDSSSFEISSFEDVPPPKFYQVQKPFGGILFDQSNDSFLDLQSLHDTLLTWVEASNEGVNLDILAFDSCLMQNIEVISEVGGVVDYIAGSNQVQNYLGLPYRKIFDLINTEISSYELAKNLPHISQASWEEGGYQGRVDSEEYKTFSLSTLATSQMENLYFFIHEVSLNLVSYLKERPSRKHELLFILEKAPRFQGETIDLGLLYGLIEKLLVEETLSGENTEKSEILRKSVGEARYYLRALLLDAKFGPLYYDASFEPEKAYLLGFFNGLSVWFPKNQVTYFKRHKEFSLSSFHKNVKSWNFLLEEVFRKDVFDF